MSDPNRSVTDRGFTIYDELTDLRAAKVCVQQLNLGAKPAVWIFSDGQAACLSIEQAARVRDALSVFISESAR